MCGIAAIFAYERSTPSVDISELAAMSDRMALRGPDAKGQWRSEDARIGLAHRRLSIIDLSDAGSQPMASAGGELHIVFNGEIYNYRELRSRLEKNGRRFLSQSDTEVLLHLYAEKGERMFDDLRGMYAFALWDAAARKMLVARDPFGIKPLYYSVRNGVFRAASQVQAILAAGKTSTERDAAGVVGFFLMGSVPEPFTFYRDIQALPAGHCAWVDASGVSEPKRFFSTADLFLEAGTQGLHQGTASEALKDSVGHHLVADVPVGIFLSAGVDSGALLGLASETTAEPLRAITLAFEEFEGSAEDESILAGDAARTYGAQHVIRRLSSAEFQKELPHVLQNMDQPTIDGVNTYFVSKAAKESGLKVVLSGLGGDELLGGYPSLHNVPLMKAAFSFPSRIPFLPAAWRRFASRLPLHPKYSGFLDFGDSDEGGYFLQRGLFMPWELSQFLPQELVEEGLRRLNLLGLIRREIEPDPGTPFSRVACLESGFYMKNQLLRDADWAGMAHSLEIRTPWVDASLWRRLAPGLKNAKRPQKQMLAASLRKPLPKAITERRKTGFKVPIDRWLEKKGGFDAWKRVPVLTRTNCPWARRWAYTLYEGMR